jgi:hypothetical protein
MRNLGFWYYFVHFSRDLPVIAGQRSISSALSSLHSGWCHGARAPGNQIEIEAVAVLSLASFTTILPVFWP